jgi:hypothetical protein
MRGRPSVWRRARVLAGVYRKQAEARITRILYELEGVDPVQFEADCRALETRFQRAGIVSRRAREELIAADLGVPVDEFRAEVEAIATQALALWEAGR